MNVNRYPSADKAKSMLAARLASELRSLQKDGIPVLLFLSGGSALGIFDRLDAECAGAYLTLAPLDERYDPDKEASNFGSFTKTPFYSLAKMAGSGFIDTRVQKGEGRDGLVNRFEDEIRQWILEHPEGRMIGMLGMGPDGHTAGIFPDDDEMSFRKKFQNDHFVVGYRAPESAIYPERVTATVSFIATQLHQSYIFLVGEEKRNVWEDVLGKRKPLHRLPAMLFHNLPRAEVFTDLPS